MRPIFLPGRVYTQEVGPGRRGAQVATAELYAKLKSPQLKSSAEVLATSTGIVFVYRLYHCI